MKKKPIQLQSYTAGEIFDVAAHFGLTDFVSQGIEYYVRYWGGDNRMVNESKVIMLQRTWQPSCASQFVNPVWKHRSDRTFTMGELLSFKAQGIKQLPPASKEITFE